MVAKTSQIRPPFIRTTAHTSEASARPRTGEAMRRCAWRAPSSARHTVGAPACCTPAAREPRATRCTPPRPPPTDRARRQGTVRSAVDRQPRLVREQQSHLRRGAEQHCVRPADVCGRVLPHAQRGTRRLATGAQLQVHTAGALQDPHHNAPALQGGGSWAQDDGSHAGAARRLNLNAAVWDMLALDRSGSGTACRAYTCPCGAAACPGPGPRPRPRPPQ